MLQKTKNQNKTVMLGLLGIAALVFAYIIGRQILVLPIILYWCAAIMLSDVEDATYLLVLITSVSRIMVYSQITWYIFIVVTYLGCIILKGRFVRGISFLGVMVIYSIVFNNADVPLNLGEFTSVVYLCLMVFFCDNLKPKEYIKAIDYYSEGFAISTVIGLFANSIPAMEKMIHTNMVVVDGEVVDQDRFGSLFGDPNNFTALNCIVIAFILFCHKKLRFRHIVLLTFLVVVGFFSYSKSYILTLAVIVLAYILKSGQHIIRNLLLLAAVGVVFLAVERALNLNVLDLLLSRFTGVESVDDLTTGRSELWKQYMDSIFADLKILMFGDGFNSRTMRWAAHNTFIEMLYRYGILGCALWSYGIFKCYKIVTKRDDGKKPKLVTTIPLWTMIAVYSFISVFHFGYVGFNIAMVIMAMYLPPEEEEDPESQYNITDIDQEGTFA